MAIISDASTKSYINELMRISLSIIWKNQYLANLGDAQIKESTIDPEAYVAARNGELNFSSVVEFAPHILRTFFPNDDEYLLVLTDKKEIPVSMRPAIVQAEQNWIIDEWENHDGEKNDYYRMLFGLPPLNMEESRYIYNTRYGDIDMETPIHQLPYTDILKLEKRGYIDELLAEHPEAEYGYLKFMGKRKIYPYVSRQAEPYEILSIDDSQFSKLRKDFVEVYEEARRMFVRVYYTDAYRSKDPLYEGFIGMCILFATQQRMNSKYIETNITRDFYDMESLRVVYDAYGMPFYSNIPVQYHVKIVKRINELISYKGSTQAFYDLFNIFDFGTMDVFEYFLVKKRLVDIKGNPIFRDVYGKPLKEEQMHDIRFARISWKDNKFVEVTKPENIKAYKELTEPDPYWKEDVQLHNKLYERDWNYFHSKYIGVEIMFELSRLLFEVCYFFRLLEDNRENTENIMCYYPVTGTDIPLYDMVIYTMALLCKNAGYTGEIPSDPAAVSAVLGFNFTEYNEILKSSVNSVNDYVVNFKQMCRDYAAQNPILAYDDTLDFYIDHVTEGAFSYLGEDFPYGEAHMAPPPVFVHDYVPTRNSITNLKEYLNANINRLKSDESLTQVEQDALFQKLHVGDNQPFMVSDIDTETVTVYHRNFYLTREGIKPGDEKVLRAAVLASYEHMLSWVLRLLRIRDSMTFDPHILKLVQDMNVYSKADVSEVYSHIAELDDYLTIKLRTAHTRIEYNAYANIRKILLTTQMVDETFTKKNGRVASTYEDLLADINPTLYKRLIMEDLDSSSEEEYAIQSLMNLCDELKLLQAVNIENINRIMSYLMKILKFLKSAKVDLTGFECIYLISARSMNYLKLLSEIYATFVEDGHLKDYIYLLDKMHLIKVFQVLESNNLELSDHNLGQKIKQVLVDYFRWLIDDGWYETVIDLYDQFQFLFDDISDMDIRHILPEDATFKEAIDYFSQFDGRSDLVLDDDHHWPIDRIYEIAIRTDWWMKENLPTMVEELKNIGKIKLEDDMKWDVVYDKFHTLLFDFARDRSQTDLVETKIGIVLGLAEFFYQTIERRFDNQFKLKLFDKETLVTDHHDWEFSLEDRIELRETIFEVKLISKFMLRIWRKYTEVQQQFRELPKHVIRVYYYLTQRFQSTFPLEDELHQILHQRNDYQITFTDREHWEAREGIMFNIDKFSFRDRDGVDKAVVSREPSQDGFMMRETLLKVTKTDGNVEVDNR